MATGERRLAAIMFTDLVGFTALSQWNESLALSVLDEQRELLRPVFSKHGGREIKTVGDAFLVDFPSALNAVKCAYEIQKTTRELNYSLPEDRKVHLRIGVHLGDIVESHGDISGDAVNVASRIEALADSGGVCLTRQVYDQVQNKFDLPLKSLGSKSLKNLRGPLEVFKMVMPWEEAGIEETVQLDSHRVAVLPLKNMSPDPNDEYFADGMTEELMTALSGVRELTVIARTSIMQYKASPKRAAEIGKELKTGTLIEGSIRKAANKVRITIQMVDAKTEGHLWAQNYDRQMDDIFAIQSEIAEKVADALKLKLVDSERRKIERKPTENTGAYTLYLKGRYYWNQRTKSSVEKGITFLNKALEADPNMALAYSDLAIVHTLMADYGMMSSVDAFARAREYAAKALSIEPNLSQPHSVLASIHEKQFQWAEADREHDLAIKLNPSDPTAYHWYSLSLARRGRTSEALEQARRAKDLDPLSPIINVLFSKLLMDTGNLNEGLKILREIVEMNENFLVGRINLAFAYYKAGMKNEAVKEARKVLEIQSWGQVMAPIANLYARTGLREEALGLLGRLLKESESEYVDPFEIAAVYAALGDNANALDWLEKSVREKSGRAHMIKIEDSFDSLRDNPRFRELVKLTGLE